MAKREDETYRNITGAIIDRCPHGHWRPLCDICNQRHGIFSNVVWPAGKEPILSRGQGK